MSESGTNIVICMGSSCFARGNSRNAAAIMEFLRLTQRKDAIQVTGTLCQNRCKQGPNVLVDGEYHCDADVASLTQLLQERLGCPGNEKP